ncbi:MAG TPA: lipoprotein [Steroidobacteraceae bacterium]|nr:lipoprotein [Steroidobacteraceae bacterium]
MNSPARAWPLVLAGALALLLGGCGQKGPLYLPNAQKAPVVPTPGAATPGGVPPQATPLAPAKAAQPSQPNDSQSDPGNSAPAAGNSPAA